MTEQTDTSTIAYRYRIRRVLSDERRVIDEIRAGHRLYNDLVAIERTRRKDVAAFWAQQGGYTDELAKLEALIARAEALPKSPERRTAWQEVDSQRDLVKERERAAIAAQDSAPKTRRKERAKELRAEAKARGEKLTPKQLADLLDAEPDCVTPRDRMRLEIVREYEDRGVKVSAKTLAKRLRESGLAGPTEPIEAAARAAAYAAYKARGVSPGTRAVVTDAHEKSLEDAGGREQRFKPWSGRGSFGVQVQGGAEIAQLYGSHTMVRLAKLPPSKGMTAGSRRDTRHELRVRIGSDGRAPAWAVFEATLHRPLPDEAKVMGVRVTVERIGVHDHWHVVFTCQVPSAVYRRRIDARIGGAVAVDIGWRSDDGNLRVGYLADARGVSEAINMPESTTRIRGVKGMRQRRTLRERHEHARSLQSILSRHFATEDRAAGTRGGMLHELADWLESRDMLPQWLVEATVSIRQWRSQPRLNRLAEQWLDNRFAGDEDILPKLDAWRRKWRHLEEWRAREAQHILAVRDEHYRLVALRLARDYDTIVINGANLALTRKRKSAKQAAPELVMVEDLKRSQAFDAAPGTLREEIVRAAKKHGRTVVPVAFDSMTCHGCGESCAYDRARHLRHRCEHCGTDWDQDENACRNALRERGGDGQSTGCARKPRKPANALAKSQDASAQTAPASA
jgi:hypothetical protein